ncbi:MULTISPECIES: GNAT family N-acetyltransferase [Neisseria]|uniref:GNAT family N-acetyltransferase n=1 Tax=Neisseria TaxID=482 RepID=UPI001E2E758B|nr:MULTISPECIES: GNAT family N-acetyltransferase [Neisseria]
MDAYIRQYAERNAKLGISRTWVALEKEPDQLEAFPKLHTTEKSEIAGYFTLSVQSINSSELKSLELPQYPTPVTLLARLAVSSLHQGKGIGRKLLLAALKKALDTSDNGLPTYAVILDVLDEDARKFYDSFNFFNPLGDLEGSKLFVPMSVVRKLVTQI